MKRLFTSKMHWALMVTGIVAFGLVAATATAYAQRDPAYQAARAAGLIGEKSDGYLGFVVTPTAEIKAMVEDLNIKRKAIYTQGAQREGVTVQLFAQRNACNLIATTAMGEKYMGPDNIWRTRNNEPPVRDPTCV